MATEVVHLNPVQTVQSAQPQSYAVRTSSVLANPEQAKINMRAAELFASSDLVPHHYRGKPANCFIAINRAQRLGVDELYFMEKTYIVKGKLGMAAELAVELANSSGRFRGPIKFRLFGEGDARGCTAFATLASDGEVVENTVTYAMAVAEEWSKNSKWQTMRDQMLQYRAGAFLVRLYAGGALGGLYMREELEDIAAQSAKQVGSSRTDQSAQIAPLVDEQPGEDIEAFEAAVKAKLEAVRTLDDLDDLWKSGINSEIRRVGGVDKAAQNRMISAFTAKKNAILKAEAETEQEAAGDAPDASEPEQPTHAAEAAEAPLTASQQHTLRKVKQDLGVEPSDTKKPVPHPTTIAVPTEDGKPAWNRWAHEALAQLKTAGTDDYGIDWARKWLAMNAENIVRLREHNADWAGRVEKLHAKVVEHFTGAADAEALKHFPTIAVEYGDDDNPDWSGFADKVRDYIRATPNHLVAASWWKRHTPIINNMRAADPAVATALEADFAKSFPQLAK